MQDLNIIINKRKRGDKMKILHVVPVTGDVVTQEMIDFIGEPLDKDTVLITEQIRKGPASIESGYDEALASPYILEICAQAKELDCEGIFINCFGDPAVEAARELVDVPVFGGFVPGALVAAGLADNFTIITVLDNVVRMIHGNIAKLGLSSKLASVRVVNMPVLGLGDHDKLYDELTTQSIKAVEKDGAQAILFGCTGMSGGAKTIYQGLLEKGYDIPVIDPVQTSLKLIETCIKLGVKPSRLTFLPVPEKERL
jgi:allantoin racemase